MNAPHRYRHQRRSQRERLPANVRLVTRPSRWGNYHPVVDDLGNGWCGYCGVPHTRAEAVAMYRRDIERRSNLAEWLAPLAGAHGLACYCPLDEPCHADVLLELLDLIHPLPEEAPAMTEAHDSHERPADKDPEADPPQGPEMCSNCGEHPAARSDGMCAPCIALGPFA